MPSKLSRDQHRLFARRFIEGFTNPYCIEYESAAGECASQWNRVLKDHVLNRLMTGRCPSKSLQLRPKFHSLFLQNSFDFQKSATFKTLK